MLDSDASGDLDFIDGFPPGVSTKLQPGGKGGGEGGMFIFVAVVFGGAGDAGAPAAQLNVLTVFDVAQRRVVNRAQVFDGLIQSVAGWDSAGLVVATLIPSNRSVAASIVLLDPAAQAWAPLRTLFTFDEADPTHPFMADSVVIGDTFVAIAQADDPFRNELLVGDLAAARFAPAVHDFEFQAYCPWGAGSFGGLA